MQDHDLYWILLLIVIITMFVLRIIQEEFRIKKFTEKIFGIIWIGLSICLVVLFGFWIMSGISTSNIQESNNFNYEDLDYCDKPWNCKWIE